MDWMSSNLGENEYEYFPPFYEIGTDASHQNAHFELVEEVLLPIDRSYIAPIANYILKKFPRSSIMTKRICTFECYDYAF